MMYKRDGIYLGMEKTVFTRRWLNHSTIHYVYSFNKSLLSLHKSFIVRRDQALCSLSFKLQMKKDLLQNVSQDHFFQLCQGQAFSGLTSQGMAKAILGQPS